MRLAVLDRQMFSEPEAARFLDVAPSTLHYWLEGGRMRGKTYKPIIRTEPRGRVPVTWAEFIEAGWLRQYRREHNVPLTELRSFIESVREDSGIPYPLAHYQPFVTGRELLRRAQDVSQLDPDYCLVAEVRGQLVLTAPAQTFVERVVWKGDLAAGWRPHEDSRSPVVMDPELRFGKPSVSGVSTEVLWEHAEEGEDVDEMAEAFDLSPADVRWALAYETSQRAA